MKKNIILGLISVFALILTACTDLGELESQVKSLESRVQALETQIKNLNANIEVTSALMQAQTISSVTQNDGTYTITLSNGEVITLTQGSTGIGKTPVMSIDNEGYWLVDYGEGKVYVMNDGKKVKATGENGVTPQFGVNDAGNWTVSYDGGETFVEVKDPSGNSVKATPSDSNTVSDPYFKNVELKDGIFTVVLKDDTSISVPVISGFLCKIESNEEIIYFNEGETKSFKVTMEGVASTIISAPDGWKAVLQDSILSVTAPVRTRAAIADTKTDVSVLALSNSGYATIAKIKVLLNNETLTLTPIALLSEGETTQNSISFNVALSNASAWKYLVLPSSETAPSAERLNETGISGEGNSAVVTSLEEGTEYTVHVVPINGNTLGNVARLNVRTKEAVITDYYQAYSSGKDIVVNGVVYNKNTNGEGILLTATNANTDIKADIHQKGGVFFLDQADGASFATLSITEITNDVILVSRYPGKNVTLVPNRYLKLIKGSLVLRNVDMDLSSLSDNYLFTNSGATEDFGRLHFENMNIRNISKALLYGSNTSNGITSTVVNNCKLQVNSTLENSIPFFNFNASTVLHAYKELIFNNNTVYNSGATAPIQIYSYNGKAIQSGTVFDGVLTVKNNIFYNTPSINTLFRLYQLSSLVMTKNAFYCDSSVQASYILLIASENQTASAVNISDNIAYGLADGKNWIIAHSNSKFIPTENIIPKVSENPFETVDVSTGTFRLSAAYSGYGPAEI